jgi:hypothetical protein
MNNFTDSFRTKIDHIIIKIDDFEKAINDSNQKKEIEDIRKNLNDFLIEFTKNRIHENYFFKFESNITIESFAESISYFNNFDPNKYSSNNNYIAIIKSDIKTFKIHSKRLSNFKCVDGTPLEITKPNPFERFLEYWFVGGILSFVLTAITYLIISSIFGADNYNKLVLFIGLLTINISCSFILIFFLNKKYLYITKLELLQHLINNPNPHLKTHDKMLDFLLHELKDDKQSDTVLGDFQKYIKSK